jgi:aminoglycoside 6'-N-acetyltransferase
LGQSSQQPLPGRQVVLRPATLEDVDALAAIFAEPAVVRWWGRRSRQDLVERLTSAHDDAVRLAVTVADVVIGMIQYDENNHPDYRSAGIDVALTSDRHRQGLGRDAVATLVRHLIEERGHHRLTIDPATDNDAAIRCYGAVGFRVVGVMRQYERRQDGNWHDGLLMDLVADDVGLVPGRDEDR